MAWGSLCRIAAGLVLVAMTAGRAGAADRPAMGGLVSIPGSPLPPVPESSVRTAIALYEPVLAGLRIFGDTVSVGRGVGYLATLYAAIRNSEKAKRLFDEAHQILVRNEAGPRDIAWVHNNRGLVELNDAEYADALRSFRSAIALLDPKQPEFLEPRAIATENLGSAYSLIGDAENAEAAYFETLDLLRRQRKEGGPAHRSTRGNLALLYSSIGDYEAARELLDVLVDERGLGRQVRFQTLINLGHVLSMLQMFPESERRLLEAQALTEDGSAERAMVLLNLSAMYNLAENFERTEEVGQLALQLTEQLYGEDSRMAAAARGNLASAALSRGELLKADRMLVRSRSVLSKGSGDQEAYVFVTRGLAFVAQRRGQTERAVELSRVALELEKKHLERILSFGSESQRLAYRKRATPYDQLANLGDPVLLAEAVLAMKGVVLDSLLAERAVIRAGRSPEDDAALDAIHALKIEIMEKIGRGESGVENLERELKRAETALAKKLAPRRRRSQVQPDLAAVQAALDRDQVLIELIRYQRYEDRGHLAPWYGGVVIPPAGALRWVPLGPVAEIDPLIEEAASRFEHGGRGAKALDSGEGASVLLSRLHDRLWAPLAKALPRDTQKVVLSPDAATSFVPWAALLDENDVFVAERWAIAQIGSGRDLLRPRVESFASTLVAMGDAGGDLPESRREVTQVARMARQRGWQTTVLVGEQASESVLQQYRRPRILHLATHGGELEARTAKGIQKRLGGNPMYRGYLLFGGGQATLEAWSRGASAPFAIDGVLTAEEASSLELSDTWLTVLSACRTGVGDARAGEGVLGLRRAFFLAGTQYLLFSLWSVKDDATADFMQEYYRRLLETRDPDRAFQETQRSELRRWREETSNISAAVYRAGAFILTR